MALWSFPRASPAIGKSNFPMATAAALKPCREHQIELTLKWCGDRNWRQTRALHHGGQAWREAGPGAGPKRNDCQAAGGWHPSWGRLNALRTQGFPGCCRAFSAAPGSQCSFFRAKSTVETGRGQQGSLGRGRGGAGGGGGGCLPLSSFCAHFVSVT